MRAGSRSAIGLLFLLYFSTISFAREAPTIAAATAGEKVRFTAPAGVCQMRVQVLSASGELLFDSPWSDGNVFDLPAGQDSHRFLVMTRDLDGRVSQTELSIDGANEANPKVTLLAHDGQNGAIVSTSGDLSFRFGDFLSGKDSERMRLTADGTLEVHAVMFPDGTLLTSAAAFGAKDEARGGTVPQDRAPVSPRSARTILRPTRIPPVDSTSTHLTPRPTFTPGYQFVTTDAGVNIGTTNPAYKLDVTGDISTGTQYKIGTVGFAHNFGTVNTFLGANAGNRTMSILNATNNTAVGDHAFTSNTNGAGDVATGDYALFHNTTGNYNTAVGSATLFSNTVAASNTAVGFGALYSNLGDAFNGVQNTAVGDIALYNNTSGNYNTAIGASALTNNVIGGSNTAAGIYALRNNSNGGYNTAIGQETLYSNTSGSQNTAVGLGALHEDTGSYNIALGNGAGQSLTTGDWNIDIGASGVAGESGTIRIGNINQTRMFVYGVNGVTIGAGANTVFVDGNGQLGTYSSSRRYKFDIADMDRATDGLMRLRPVTFRYLVHGDAAPLQYGLIAEEVAEIYPEMVTRNKDGQVETVMYQFLAPMLLNEVQKQRKTIDALERRLEALEKLIK